MFFNVYTLERPCSVSVGTELRSWSRSLPFWSVGFILQANKEADLLWRRGDRQRMVLGGRGARLGDLPVAAVEIQAGQGR